MCVLPRVSGEPYKLSVPGPQNAGVRVPVLAPSSGFPTHQPCDSE